MSFNVCVKCKLMFTSDETYKAHLDSHNRKSASPPVEQPPKEEPQIMYDENEKINTLAQKNVKKKILIHSGIEAQTMTDAEVEERYAEEKAKGKVK